MINLKFVLGLTILLLPFYAKAEFSLELSRSGGGSAYSHNAAIGYSLDSFVDEDTDSAGLNNSVQYSFSNSINRVNLNTALSDFDIVSNSHDLVYSLTFYDTVSIDASYAATEFNDKEALDSETSVGINVKLGAVRLGVSTANGQTKQNTDVVVLTKNIKDQIKFNQTTVTYSLSVKMSENLSTALRYSYYSYDKNLNDMYAILTTQIGLNKAGGSVASELQNQNKNSSELDLTYAFNDYWVGEIGVGTTQDYLDPEAKANCGKFNIEYDNKTDEFAYRIFVGLSSFKAHNETNSNYTANAGIGFIF